MNRLRLLSAPALLAALSLTACTPKEVPEMPVADAMDEGVHPSVSVRDSPYNPFDTRLLAVKSDILATDCAAGFYAFATALALEPTGEHQYYAASCMHTLVQSARLRPEDDYPGWRIAVEGYPAVLDVVPDPGFPSYPERMPRTADSGDGFLEDPLEEGELRLGIGVFYEGPTTSFVPIDDSTTRVYVYENSFAVETSDDRVEGYASDALVLRGNPWWGGGVHWDAPQDLSAYDMLHVALKTDGLTAWSIGLTGGSEGRVNVGDAGLVADGDWLTLDLPLASFAGVDLTAVSVALLLVGEGGEAGDRVQLDDLYFRGIAR